MKKKLMLLCLALGILTGCNKVDGEVEQVTYDAFDYNQVIGTTVEEMMQNECLSVNTGNSIITIRERGTEDYKLALVVKNAANTPEQDKVMESSSFNEVGDIKDMDYDVYYSWTEETGFTQIGVLLNIAEGITADCTLDIATAAEHFKVEDAENNDLSNLPDGILFTDATVTVNNDFVAILPDSYYNVAVENSLVGCSYEELKEYISDAEVQSIVMSRDLDDYLYLPMLVNTIDKQSASNVLTGTTEENIDVSLADFKWYSYVQSEDAKWLYREGVVYLGIDDENKYFGYSYIPVYKTGKFDVKYDYLLGMSMNEYLYKYRLNTMGTHTVSNNSSIIMTFHDNLSVWDTGEKFNGVVNNYSYSGNYSTFKNSLTFKDVLEDVFCLVYFELDEESYGKIVSNEDNYITDGLYLIKDLDDYQGITVKNVDVYTDLQITSFGGLNDEDYLFKQFRGETITELVNRAYGISAMNTLTDTSEYYIFEYVHDMGSSYEVGSLKCSYNGSLNEEEASMIFATEPSKISDDLVIEVVEWKTYAYEQFTSEFN